MAVRLASFWCLLDVPALHLLFFFTEKGDNLVLKVSHDIVPTSFLLELKMKFKSNFIFQKEKGHRDRDIPQAITPNIYLVI